MSIRYDFIKETGSANMIRIYVKTPSENWMLVKGTTSISLGYKQSSKVRHVLVAEAVDKPDVGDKPIKTIKIPSTKVMQIIHRLLQSNELGNVIVTVDKVDEESYRLQIYKGNANAITEVIRKALTREKKDTKTGSSTSPTS